ncbi:MAG: hypothetical protein HRT57_17370, partial [Crocinitomicaceae bacterium]|nr:hypothetical protein [Crocinitomicaceae bacterium]
MIGSLIAFFALTLPVVNTAFGQCPGIGTSACSAVSLSVNAGCVTTAQRTNNCSKTPDPATCSSETSARNAVWSTFTTVSTMDITVTYTPGNNRNIVVHLYNGACGAPSAIACENSNPLGAGAAGEESLVYNNLPAGTYYTRVEAINANGTSAASTICIFGSISGAPGNVASNLELWLKADRGVTGTTNVSAWADQSGNSNNASEGTNQPQLISNSANFNPGIRFSLSDILTGSSAMLNGDDTHTLFIVTKDIGSTGGFPDIFRYSNAGSRIELRTASTEIGIAGGGGASSNNLTTTDLNIYSLVGNGTNDIGYGNGDIGSSRASDAIVSSGGYIIGQTDFNADVMEVIAYDRDLSATAGDLEKIHSYLAIKYGITLDNTVDPSGDYLASDGTKLWDAGNNSVYHNDVTGIGRDDDSGLDQQKSLSVNSDGIVIMDKGAVFGADLDFILWGNDNTAATLAGAELVTGYTQKMTREWKAAVNGTPGTVTVRIILAGNTGAAGNYALHVDDDGVFTSGVISSTAGSSISGDTITFNAVSIANGNFFTLGYKPITAPGAVTSNLSLWLKANTGVEEGASNPAEDGDVVTSWLDQSASGNDATAVVTPTFATNSVNFNPAVTLLDGSSEYFTVAGLNINPSTTDFSMIAVHRSTNSGDDQVI